MNEEIKSILGDELAVDGKMIPVAFLNYRGHQKTFITWTVIGEDSAFKAGDEYLYSVCSLDIDVYSDRNYLKIINEIKKLMTSNDWLWVEDSADMYEEDTELYHKTLTFEKERYIEWQE